MAKKQKKRNTRQKSSPAHQSTGGRAAVISNKPVIPAFWIAVIIPVICFVGAWSFPPVATPMELKSYASQIYLSGLLFLWLWLQRKRLVAELTFSPARICFGLLFLAGTLSLLWASNSDFWVYKWNKWYAGFIMFLLGLQILQNEKNLDTVINLAIIGGLITALIGIAQYLFGFNGVPQTSFPSSTFGNGNMAGQVMVLTAWLPLYFLFKDRLTKAQTWYYALSLTVLLLYAFYTRTRAVWISCAFEAFLIGIFIFFDKVRRSTWLNWNSDKSIAGASALGIFLILVNFNDEGFQPFWEIAVYEISSIAESIATDAEARGGQRYLIWGTVQEMVKDHPIIGSGLGNFFDIYNTQGYAHYRIMGVQRAHNDVFELAVELGALGIVLLLSIIVSMCHLLYKLILHSEGEKRRLFALLTIVVTGSMMNAQLSFPYQLPVPLVIMPFFLALVIKGSEDIEKNITTFNLPALFNKIAPAMAGAVFVLITINDLIWMHDIHNMNRIISDQNSNDTWKPKNPVYNQAYITAARSVNQAFININRHQQAMNIMQPVLDYWPEVAANTMIASINNLHLGNLEEAKTWARATIKSQPEGSYIGEFHLMDAYLQSNQMDNLKELYDSIKNDPEELLRRNKNTYNMLHSMAINTRDFDRVTYFYDKYIEYFGEDAAVIANQAIFFINTGRLAEAVPYMKRALELNEKISLANQFIEFLAQIPEASSTTEQ